MCHQSIAFLWDEGSKGQPQLPCQPVGHIYTKPPRHTIYFLSRWSLLEISEGYQIPDYLKEPEGKNGKQFWPHMQTKQITAAVLEKCVLRKRKSYNVGSDFTRCWAHCALHLQGNPRTRRISAPLTPLWKIHSVDGFICWDKGAGGAENLRTEW